MRKAATPSRLVRVAEPALTYRFDGTIRTVDDFLARTPTTGLLIARGDTILVERYQYGRTDRQRFASYSMAKTVTAMLVGIALHEGHLRSVDDLAETYVPELAGTAYGATSLLHLLQMSSGVRFSEDYSGHDDFARFIADTYRLLGPGGPAAVKPYNERQVPAGTRFAYASPETYVLGLVLRRAIHRPVAEYCEAKLWGPMGAEADASWLVDSSGQEVAFMGINAVLRDYARLGLVLAHDGAWPGRQLIPPSWVRAATTVRDDQPHLRADTASPGFGYGYQTWLLPGPRRMFLAWGARGQRMFADPRSRLVMVITSVHKLSLDVPPLVESGWLWHAVVRQLGG